MTDRIMHIRFKPQDMQLVKKSLLEKSYSHKLFYDKDLDGVSIDMSQVTSCKTLCDAITDLIIDIIRVKNLKDYIWNNYTKIDDEEKQNVYDEAENIFRKKNDFLKENIYDKIYDFIRDNNNENLDMNLDMNLDGFFKFRMKDYMSYIAIISDIALEEHLIKRDRREFLDSLKYFVDIQEEKLKLLRVTITKDGLFILSDEDGNLLEELNNKELISMALQENLNQEDILISAVMTLCPKKIEIVDYLKNDKSKDIIEILKLLFEGRVNEIYMS